MTEDTIKNKEDIEKIFPIEVVLKLVDLQWNNGGITRLMWQTNRGHTNQEIQHVQVGIDTNKHDELFQNPFCVLPPSPTFIQYFTQSHGCLRFLIKVKTYRLCSEGWGIITGSDQHQTLFSLDDFSRWLSRISF